MQKHANGDALTVRAKNDQQTAKRHTPASTLGHALATPATNGVHAPVNGVNGRACATDAAAAIQSSTGLHNGSVASNGLHSMCQPLPVGTLVQLLETLTTRQSGAEEGKAILSAMQQYVSQVVANTPAAAAADAARGGPSDAITAAAIRELKASLMARTFSNSASNGVFQRVAPVGLNGAAPGFGPGAPSALLQPHPPNAFGDAAPTAIRPAGRGAVQPCATMQVPLPWDTDAGIVQTMRSVWGMAPDEDANGGDVFAHKAAPATAADAWTPAAGSSAVSVSHPVPGHQTRDSSAELGSDATSDHTNQQQQPPPPPQQRGADHVTGFAGGAAPYLSNHVAPFLHRPYKLLDELHATATARKAASPTQTPPHGASAGANTVCGDAGGSCRPSPEAVVDPGNSAAADAPVNGAHADAVSNAGITTTAAAPTGASPQASSHAHSSRQPARPASGEAGAQGCSGAVKATGRDHAFPGAEPVAAQAGVAAQREITAAWKTVLDMLINAGPQVVQPGSPFLGTSSGGWGSTQSSTEQDAVSQKSEDPSGAEGSTSTGRVGRAKRRRNRRAKAAGRGA